MTTDPTRLLEERLDQLAETVDVTDTVRSDLRQLVALVTAGLSDDDDTVLTILASLTPRELIVVASTLVDVASLLVAERCATTGTDPIEHIRALGRWVAR